MTQQVDMKAVEQELIIQCPNCKAANSLGACLQERNDGTLIEGGLECPECGQWTHSYWKNVELLRQATRMEQLRTFYLQSPTPGRWTTYETARDTYKKNFEEFQERMLRKTKGKEAKLSEVNHQS